MVLAIETNVPLDFLYGIVVPDVAKVPVPVRWTSAQPGDGFIPLQNYSNLADLFGFQF